MLTWRGRIAHNDKGIWEHAQPDYLKNIKKLFYRCTEIDSEALWGALVVSSKREVSVLFDKLVIGVGETPK